MVKLQYGNVDQFISFSGNSCAILGANGCGKSSLKNKIVRSNNNICHISAQRNLGISQDSKKGYTTEALAKESELFESKGIGAFHKENFKNDHRVLKSYNNFLQNDFDSNLEDVLRDDLESHANEHKNLRKSANPEINKDFTTTAERIFNIWGKVFSDKKIQIDSGKIKIIDKNVEPYEIDNMSDGERSALYLILKCLQADKGDTIIVDEAETHLNPAILQDLWDEIEYQRSDCRFLYISHNVEFISSRKNCTKFWVKSFCFPEKWEMEEIHNDIFPEELIIKVIGSKKQKVLFVESEKGKDERLYSKIYPAFKVIPVSSCEDVIRYTKTLNDPKSQNYNKEYFGLIDRDVRCDSDIENLNNKKIFVLPVAQYENLFFRKEVLRFFMVYLNQVHNCEKVIENLECKDKGIFNLKNNPKFKKDFYGYYIKQHFNQNLKKFDLLSSFSFVDDFSIINKKWENIVNENDYNLFLQKCKCKEIKGFSVKINYLKWDEFEDQILNIFDGSEAENFRNLFLTFMPDINSSLEK